MGYSDDNNGGNKLLLEKAGMAQTQKSSAQPQLTSPAAGKGGHGTKTEAADDENAQPAPQAVLETKRW